MKYFQACLIAGAALLVGCQSSVPRMTETPPAGTTWAVYQPFEGGFMLWPGNANCVYVYAYTEASPEGFIVMPPDAGTPGLGQDYHYCLEARAESEAVALPTAPEGLLTPDGTLGAIWRSYDLVHDTLGYATGQAERYAGALPAMPTATFGGGPYFLPLLTLPDGRVLSCGFRAATARTCYLQSSAYSG